METRLVRILLALLVALAPAINLAAPVAPRASVADVAVGAMDRTGFADARLEICVHDQSAAADSDCGKAGHAGTAHHADPLCLQCIAFGTPGLPGAPDIATVVPAPVAATAYRCAHDSGPASREPAAQACRGPPSLV